jgi:hypothetical protein
LPHGEERWSVVVAFLVTIGALLDLLTWIQ